MQKHLTHNNFLRQMLLGFSFLLRPRGCKQSAEVYPMVDGRAGLWDQTWALNPWALCCLHCYHACAIFNTSGCIFEPSTFWSIGPVESISEIPHFPISHQCLSSSVLNQGQLALQGDIGNVWRHLSLLYLEVECHWHLLDRGQGCC